MQLSKTSAVVRVLSTLAGLWWTPMAAAAPPAFPFHGTGANYRAAPLDFVSQPSSVTKIAGYELQTKATAYEEGDLCAYHIVETLVALDGAAPVASLRGVYESDDPRRWALLSWSGATVSDETSGASGHQSERLTHDAHSRAVRELDPLTPEQRTALSNVGAELGDSNAALLRARLPTGSPPSGALGSSMWPLKLSGSVVHRFLLASASQGGECPRAPTRTHVVYSTLGKTNAGPEGTVAVGPSGVATREVDFAASRTVRIEFANTDGTAKMAFCSGLLLSPRVVLTAGHCVEKCGPESRECASYTVDADLRFAPAGVVLSVPVLSAESYLPAGYDYGLLYLSASTRLESLWKVRPVSPSSSQWVVEYKDGTVWLRSGTLYTPITQQLFAHPSGFPMLSSTCDVHVESEGAFAHTCYSDQGSSGGILWFHVGDSSAILALHRRYATECKSGTTSTPDWSDAMEEQVVAANVRSKRSCLNQAAPIKGLWLTLCSEGKAGVGASDLGAAREAACKELSDAQILRRPAG